MINKLTKLILLFCFISTLGLAQNQKGATNNFLYTRTRCIECTFAGCISISQDVNRDPKSGKAIFNDIKISTYSFPCACNQGPKIPEFVDENGNSPYPYDHKNYVETSKSNGGSIYNYSRTFSGDHTLFYKLFLGDWSDDDIFGLPDEYFVRLLDKTWPFAYPKTIIQNGITLTIPQPTIGCDVAPSGLLTDGGNSAELNELLNELHEKIESGGASTDEDNWYKKMMEIKEKLKDGGEVKLPNSLIDFGRKMGGPIYHWGDCYDPTMLWNNQIFNIVGTSTCNTDPKAYPLSYEDPNIWQYCYPINQVIVVRLNDGQILFDDNYDKVKAISYDFSNQAPGTLLSVTAYAFNGRVFNTKVVKQ